MAKAGVRSSALGAARRLLGAGGGEHVPGGARGVALVLLAAVVVAGAADRIGSSVVLAGVAGGAVGLLLLANARWAAALVVLVVVVCEDDPQWGVPLMARPYAPLAAGVAPVDLLLLTAAAAAIVLAVSRGRLHLPRPFGVPLALLGVAFVLGVMNGVLGGGGQAFQVLTTSLSYLPLALVPFIVVNVVRPGADLRRVVGWAAALAGFKAVAGLFVVYAGVALVAGPDLPPLTYYAPTGNLCLMVLVLAALAGALSGARLPAAFTLLSLLAVVALLLSYRRTFWLGTVAAVAVVIVVASRRETRRLIVPALLVLALAGTLVVRAGLGGNAISGELADRVTSLTPSRVSTNDQDRYRLTERRNVLEELRRRPLTGIGVGVAWKQRYPVNFTYDFLDYYVHTAVLWHWLKEGVLGVIAYLALYVSAFAAGLRVFRRHPDGRVRAFGLGAGAAFVGLAVVEGASTVVGADVRSTLVVGVLLGLLSVAYRDLPARTSRASPI